MTARSEDPSRVLVIDDEPFSRMLLVRQLENLGVGDVLACESGGDALRHLEALGATVRLILCDLQMPGMDGVEFVRHLVRVGYSGNLVLVSGEDARTLQTAEKAARAHRLRVLASLQKPVTPDRLRELLDAQRPLADAVAPPSAGTYDVHDLRQALARGELENRYQPKVQLTSRAVQGVEALVRWRHPGDGLVLPDRFIGIAEEHGLIDDLTRIVLAAALRDVSRWRHDGLRVHVAVNVSMETLGRLNFPDVVARELDRAGVPASSLLLELTESRVWQDSRVPLDVLTRLRLKHVRLSIDDFGTGHSSLVKLRDLPFDELKVDSSFVHGAWSDGARAAILQASLRMARQLGMTTVGEGVEDQSDWEFLRAVGCDLAQGYFIARPMPAAELAGWMAQWEHRRRLLAVPA